MAHTVYGSVHVTEAFSISYLCDAQEGANCCLLVTHS